LLQLILFTFCDSLQIGSGTETLVRHWNSLWSIWITRTCRGSIFSGDAHAARFWKGQRNLLSSWYNL
jgi:hypothetical protein